MSRQDIAKTLCLSVILFISPLTHADLVVKVPVSTLQGGGSASGSGSGSGSGNDGSGSYTPPSSPAGKYNLYEIAMAFLDQEVTFELTSNSITELTRSRYDFEIGTWCGYLPDTTLTSDTSSADIDDHTDTCTFDALDPANPFVPASDVKTACWNQEGIWDGEGAPNCKFSGTKLSIEEVALAFESNLSDYELSTGSEVFAIQSTISEKPNLDISDWCADFDSATSLTANYDSATRTCSFPNIDARDFINESDVIDVCFALGSTENVAWDSKKQKCRTY